MKATKVFHVGKGGVQQMEFDEEKYRQELHQRYKSYMEQVKETEAI